MSFKNALSKNIGEKWNLTNILKLNYGLFFIQFFSLPGNDFCTKLYFSFEAPFYTPFSVIADSISNTIQSIGNLSPLTGFRKKKY